MWGIDFEIDWLPVDALVVASYSSRLILDFAFHILEVGEPTIGNMMELCPFQLRCNAC